MMLSGGRTEEVTASGDELRGARRAAHLAQSVVMILAGVAGVVVLLAALAPFLGVQIVRLQTGSMSPGYPAGSLLLAQDVAATEVRPGDIVTVRRADGTPVTHRVVTQEAAGDGARLILRGDANEQDDHTPYLVTRVGRVLGGIPFGGSLFDTATAPGAIPVLAGGVSLLVLWAWWPERRRPAHRMAARPRQATHESAKS